MKDSEDGPRESCAASPVFNVVDLYHAGIQPVVPDKAGEAFDHSSINPFSVAVPDKVLGWAGVVM